MFLVVLGNADGRRKILEETPMYLRGKMILAFLWDPSFDMKTIRTTEALVWVDLMTLNLVFEGLERGLLKQVGKVMYVALQNARCKYSNLRSIVKVDLTKALRTYVVVPIEGIGD